jgi:hypothetical protein
LNLSSSLEEVSSETDVNSYTRWQDIFRSWFWRYYDHLFQLIFYNLGWFSTCFGVSWIANYWGILGKPQQWNWFSIYLVYVLESAASFVWAFAVFKVFIEDKISWSELYNGLRCFFWKALISAGLSGLILGLVFYNLRFYFSLQLSSHIWIIIPMGFVATVFIYVIMMTFYQWPILFFQNPPLDKLFYKCFLITLGSGPYSLFFIFFSALSSFFFFLMPFLWFFIGFVFIYSVYVVALEKHFLRYKITYHNKPISDYLKSIDEERKRGWRDIFKPWETQ